MRLVVVGCGSIGARHARNAAALGVSSIAVFDPDGSRRSDVARESGATAYASLAVALESGPDAAIICTPPADHVASAQACADAGCDLLIEKPLAAAVDGLDRLESVIAERKLRAAVAYQLRFHPAVARMRDLVCSGQIGRLLAVQAEYGQYLPAWRPSRDYRETYTAQAALGGGILLDGSHEIDYIRWIGGEIHGVYALAARLSDLAMDAEDTAALVMRFQSNAVAEIHLDCVQRGYSRKCTLIGTEATVRWDAGTGLQITTAAATHNEPAVPEPNRPYLDELAAFLSGSVDAPLASFRDGRRVLQIVLAARESAARRQEVTV